MKPNEHMIAMLRRLDHVELLANIISKDGPLNKNKSIEYYYFHALAGAHKARIAVGPPFTNEEIKASKKWLLEHNFTTTLGEYDE